MAFESLSERLNRAFKNITGKGKLTEKNMEDMLKEVRLALLEADVNYKIVKSFLENVKQKAIGQNVYTSLNPGQMVVKIVHDELIVLLGENDSQLNTNPNGMTKIMLVGLQGTGKTTSIAKIANLCKNKLNKNPMLIAADVIRPAAIEQLKTLGESIGVEVFSLGTDHSAVEAVEKGMIYAREKGYDMVLIDTAGRLHIDDELMNELVVIREKVHPEEILLTVDAMTGQDIINVAKTFHERLNVTGLVVTKFDGDSRGGGVLSVRAITNVPVKFVGQGEKIEDLDIFYPDRMADRILGMGDIMTLIEQAEQKMDYEKSKRAAERMMNGTFTLDDMLEQLEQVSKMGSISKLLGMIPGLNQLTSQINDDDAEKNMKVTKAIISSMTMKERENPSMMRNSHKNRIAKGSGTSVQEINKLINQFEKMKKMMKQMSAVQKSGRMPNMNQMMGPQSQMRGFMPKGKRK